MPLRFPVEDLKALEAAAKSSGQILSGRIRSTLNAAVGAQEIQMGTRPKVSRSQ
jgi:hypothetical protein